LCSFFLLIAMHTALSYAVEKKRFCTHHEYSYISKAKKKKIVNKLVPTC